MAPKDSQNYYSLLNNPEVLEKRKKYVAELEEKIKHMLEIAPGRVPTWDRERIVKMDTFCLVHEKRCIMWDDEGNGFYLLMNWDWLKNQPRYYTEPMQKFETGWWQNLREMIKAPLIDPTLADDKVASWIDANTMAAHQFLDKLDLMRRDEEGKLVLDGPYGEELAAVQLSDWSLKPPTVYNSDDEDEE